jgi:biopolymer transport protein ExbB
MLAIVISSGAIMSFIKIFQDGGVVMYPLLALSILALALVFERSLFWIKLGKQQGRLVRDVLGLYRRSTRSAVEKLEQNINFPIARIFLAALELDEPNPEDFRLALESAGQAEIPLLKRFNTAFETVISVAPLLGLLGTVLGLMNSFRALKIGEVNASASANVTGGIAEALTSTAAGLVVAVSTLLFANMFRGLYVRQIAQIQEYGGQLELIYRRRYEKMRYPAQP